MNALGQFSKKDLKIATDVWITKLFTNLDYTGRFYYYNDTKKMSFDIENAKLDFVSMNPLNLIKHFDLSKLEPSFSEGAKDVNDLYLVVLINAKSNINSYKDFKNKKIILDLNEPVSKMCIDYYYLKANGDLNINYENSTSSQNSILKLFFNKADVTIVRYKNYKLSIELNPQIAKKVLVFEKTKLRNTQMGMYRKSLNIALKEMITHQSSILNQSVDGRQILDIYKIEKIEQTNMQDLANIKKFYEKFRKLKEEKDKGSN